jgi:hypothetical protein
MPKPNAGGGRNNQGKANVSARARFSKPIPKKLIDQIKKKKVDRAVRNHEDSKQPKQGGGGGGPSKIQSIPLDKKLMESKQLMERLDLPKKLLTELLILFEGPRPEDKAPTVRVPQLISTSTSSSSSSSGKIDDNTAKECTIADVSKKNKIDLPFSLSTAPANQPKQNASSRNQSLQSVYEKYGFLSNEIRNMSKNKCTFDNEQFLSLLVNSREHSFPTPADVSKTHLPISSNEDLKSELEVLTSIYENDVFHEDFVAFGFMPCTRISVLMEINDVQFEIRMFISNADQYPSLHSKLYGWLIDPVAISISKTPGVTHNACLDSDSLRLLSLEAMEKIQYHHVQVEAPVAFDFVQHLNDSVPEYIALMKSQGGAGKRTTTAAHGLKKGNSTALKSSSSSKAQKDTVKDAKKTPISKAQGTQNSSNNSSSNSSGSGSSGKQKGSNAKKQGKEATGASKEDSEEPPSKAPRLPPMPVTFHIRGDEYRAAFSTALGKGLARKAAQNLVMMMIMMKMIVIIVVIR